MSKIIIKQVFAQDELEKIFQLRYEIYKSVLNVDIPCMDHQVKQLKEEIDKKAIVLGAFSNGKIVGTVRGLLFKGLNEDEIFLAKHYNIFNYKDATTENSAEVARLCVLKEYQKQGVTFMLLRELLKIGTSNLKYVFLETLDFLVDYYKFFHFVPLSDPIFNAEYKLTMYPMVLELSEINQFLK